MSERERITIKKTFEGKEFDVVYIKGNPGKSKAELDEMRARGERVSHHSYCAPLTPRVYESAPGINCYQDVACRLRDGTTIYCDIYRPAHTTEKIPVIVSWGAYGKRPAEGQDEWKLMGVPPRTVSEMAKFESADPAYWCYYDYAVANVDPRGVGNSEGNLNLWGTEDAQDGYDFIEWITAQDWCNGKATLFGNSGVCMGNWKIAAAQPPHLVCLAAWEGISDLYRESYFCGGVPNPDYEAGIINTCACPQYVEDTISMIHQYPLINEYWEDKRVRWEKIRIPTYCTGGWVHHHLRGSFEGYRRIRSAKKWMRVHRDFEWPDAYNPVNLEELKRFYDRYCKDIHNGWEFTPKVRVQVMDAYDYDYATNRPEKEFPLARTQYKKLYLDAASHGAALEEQYAQASEVVYDPKTEVTTFDYTFTEDTELTGYMKLHLWVECRGHDNMDLFPWVMKLDKDGNMIPIVCMDGEYRGAWAFYRCSHRKLDEKLSTPYQPVQAHRELEPMEQGVVYPVEIEFYPHSRIWHKGEKLRLQFAGKFIKTDWFHDRNMNHQVDNGDGLHVIHTGGEYDSYLQIPVIPPKYTSGEFTYKG